jgi:hypothetical protein
LLGLDVARQPVCGEQLIDAREVIAQPGAPSSSCSIRSASTPIEMPSPIAACYASRRPAQQMLARIAS